MAVHEKEGVVLMNDADLIMGIGFLVLGILLIIIGLHKDWWG